MLVADTRLDTCLVDPATEVVYRWKSACNDADTPAVIIGCIREQCCKVRLCSMDRCRLVHCTYKDNSMKVLVLEAAAIWGS